MHSHLTTRPVYAVLFSSQSEPYDYPLDIVRLIIILSTVELHVGEPVNPEIKLHVTPLHLVQAGRLTRPTARTKHVALRAAREILNAFLCQRVPNVDPTVNGSATQGVHGVISIEDYLKALQHLVVAVDPRVVEPRSRRGGPRSRLDATTDKGATLREPASVSDRLPLEGPRRPLPAPGQRTFVSVEGRPPGFDEDKSGLSADDLCITTSRYRAANVAADEQPDAPRFATRMENINHQMWLADQFFTGSARVLSSEEFLSVQRELVKRSGQGPLTRLSDEQCAARVLLLMGCSGRSWQVAAQAEIWEPGIEIHPQILYIDVAAGVLLLRLRIPQNRWSPRGSSYVNNQWHASGYHGCTEVMTLPLPKAVASVMRNTPVTQGEHRLLPIDPRVLEKPLRILSSVLKETVSHTFSAARLRAFVPAVLIEKTGDAEFAKVISGQSLGFSDSDIFYYSEKVTSVISRFTEALDILAPFSAVQPEHILAPVLAVSRLGLLHDEHFTTFVSRLQNDINAVRHQGSNGLSNSRQVPATPSAELAFRLAQLTALTRYTIWMDAANDGCRITEWMSHQTVDDLSVDYFQSDDFSNSQLKRDKGRRPDHELRDSAFSEAFGTRRDKLVYPSNLTRVTAKARVVVEQVTAMLEALAEFEDWLIAQKTLPREVTTPLIERLREALSGDGPVYLYFNGEQLVPATSEWMASCVPEGIPTNFLRHRLNRKAIEYGASPIDRANHEGHPVLGVPFGVDSIDTPTEFSKRLSPILDRYLIADGWRIERIPGTKGRCWQRHLKVRWDSWTLHTADCKALTDLYKTRRDEFRTLRKDNRGQIDHAIEEAVRSHLGNKALEPSSSPQKIEPEVLAKIILAVQQQMPSDALKEAAALRLRWWASIKRTRDNWNIPLPGLIYQQVTPFDVLSRQHLRSLRIVRQVRRLIWNEHQRKQLSIEQKQAWYGISSASCDPVSRFVASLVFEAGVTNVEAVIAALRGIPDAIAVDSLEGVILLPLVPFGSETKHKIDIDANATDIKSDDQSPTEIAIADHDAEPSTGPTQCERRSGSLALAGRVAAAALALRSATATAPLSIPHTSRDVLRSLVSALPKEIRAPASATWDTYAQVVEMALRVERPGSLPLSRHHGVESTLPLNRLLSTFGCETNGPVSEHKCLESSYRKEIRKSATALSSDYEDYKLLISELGRIAAIRHSSTARKVANASVSQRSELEINYDDDERREIAGAIATIAASATQNVRLLAKFSIHLMKREKYKLRRRGAIQQQRTSQAATTKTTKRRKLRFRSVLTYVSSLGPSLIDRLQGRELTSLDSDDLISVYREVIFRRAPEQQSHLFSLIAEFHRVLSSEALLPDISLAEVAEDLPDVPASCEAAFVTEVEYARTIAQIDTWLKAVTLTVDPTTAETYRLIKAARVLIILMYRLGLRVGEGRRLRFVDVIRCGQSLLLHVHSNQLGSTKSFFSNRSLDLSASATAEELAFVLSWISEEGTYQGLLSGRAINPVFGSDEHPEETLSSSKLNLVMTAALRIGTGDPNARPHWLRHARAMNWLTPVLVPWLPIGRADRSVSPGGGRIHPLLVGLWSSRQLGHSRVSTTLGCYEHIRLFTSLDVQIRQQTRMTLREISQAACINDSAVRQRCSSDDGSLPLQHTHPAIRRFLYWRRINECRQNVAKSRLIRKVPLAAMRRRHLTPIRLVDCIADMQRGEHAAALTRKYSISRDRFLKLLDTLLEWQMSSRYWIIDAAHLEQLRSWCGASSEIAIDSELPSRAPLVHTLPIKSLLNGCSKLSIRELQALRPTLRVVLSCFDFKSGFQGVTTAQRSAIVSIADIFRITFQSDHLFSHEGGSNISERHLFCTLLTLEAFIAISRKKKTIERSSLSVDHSRLSVIRHQ